jgi:hypothetical protein
MPAAPLVCMIAASAQKVQRSERWGNASSANNTFLLNCKPSVLHRVPEYPVMWAQRGTLRQNQERVYPYRIIPSLVGTKTSTGRCGKLTKGGVRHVGMLWQVPHAYEAQL